MIAETVDPRDARTRAAGSCASARSSSRSLPLYAIWFLLAFAS